MELQHKLHLFEEMIDDLTKDFVHHLFHEEWEEDTEDYYWISEDRTGTLEINDTWWGLSTIIEVLHRNYPSKIVHKWYNYTIDNCGDDREYYINLESFVRIYDGSNLDEWAKKYHDELNKNRMFWESPAGRKKEEEQIKLFVDAFKKEMQSYIDNKK